jgi:hypothetical protein
MSKVKSMRSKEIAAGEESITVLRPRDLNRALLARQMLLSRVTMSALDAIERLVGMQAQAPTAPYFGLWSRLYGFDQEELSELLRSRKVVRIALMRSTLHLVSDRDCLTLRPWLQPVLERSLKGSFGKQLNELDLHELAAQGRALVEAEPRTFNELGKKLSEHWPDREPAALTAAVRTMVPLVQLPPRGIWGMSGQAKHTSMEAWLGQPLSTLSASENTVLRYLAAYGPATTKDIQVWSGITRLNVVMEKLRPHLITFRDEQGKELFDLPNAPRPKGDIPAPPRFLGEFDNMLLSYADRTRIMDETYRKRVFTENGIIRSTILVDGFVRGTWKMKRERGKAVLIIEPFKRLSAQEHNDLTEEGARLLSFTAPEDDSHDIVFLPSDG